MIPNSGCSKHMSRKLCLFTKLKELTDGAITLGDKAKCNIPCIGKVGCNSSNSIDDVLLVDGLKYKSS